MTIEFRATKFSPQTELREYLISGKDVKVSDVIDEALRKQGSYISAISCQPDEMGTKSSIVRARRHATRAFGDTQIELLSSSNRKIWLLIDCSQTPLRNLVRFLPSFWILAGDSEQTKYPNLDEFREIFECTNLNEQVDEILIDYAVCARLWRDRQPLLQLFLPCSI